MGKVTSNILWKTEWRVWAAWIIHSTNRNAMPCLFMLYSSTTGVSNIRPMNQKCPARGSSPALWTILKRVTTRKHKFYFTSPVCTRGHCESAQGKRFSHFPYTLTTLQATRVSCFPRKMTNSSTVSWRSMGNQCPWCD